MIVAYVFDLDQTLFDRRTAFNNWLVELPLTSGQRHQLVQLDQNGHGDRASFFRTLESHLQQTVSQQTFVESLLKYDVQQTQQLIELIGRLKSQHLIGLLTNGTSCSQRCKIDRLGLNHVIDERAIFISEEIGHAKPSSSAFGHVSRSLGISPCECHYIGDQWESDILAARQAGWGATLVQGPSDVVQFLECHLGCRA